MRLLGWMAGCSLGGGGVAVVAVSGDQVVALLQGTVLDATAVAVRHQGTVSDVL